MKNHSINDRLFYSLVGIMLIIIISPLLIKLKFVRNVSYFFIADLHSMKGDYLGMLGTLVGSCLAITGALWTQKKINDDVEYESVKKSARLIVFDLERTFKFIISSYTSNCFNLNLVNWKVKLNEKWDENILDVSKYIKDSETEDLIKLYDDIYILSTFIEKLIDSHNEIEESTHGSPFQVNGDTHTTIRNKTAEKYSEECNKLVDSIVKKIVSETFIYEVSSDLKTINDLIEIYNVKNKELGSFRGENNIPYILSDKSKKDIDPEVILKCNKLDEDRTKAWDYYNHRKNEIKEKWRNKVDASKDNIELNHKYIDLIASVKRIYS